LRERSAGAPTVAGVGKRIEKKELKKEKVEEEAGRRGAERGFDPTEKILN